MQISDTLKTIQKTLQSYPTNPILIAVTKYATISQMEELAESGHLIVGENKVQ